MNLKKWQKKELLGRCQLVIADAEFAPDESWTKQDVDFQDNCGCYSEWTQESCSLGVTIRGTFAGDGHQERQDLEDTVERWAKGALEWSGCSCCENRLSVNVYLFPRKAVVA